jgi:hypothetical protein
MDPLEESVMTPEGSLLKRIEHALTVVSQEQHARARQAAILRRARTLLHLGCSTIEVKAMLAEHLRKEPIPPRAASGEPFDLSA